MAASRFERVPAVWLAFTAIVSVQFGAAIARSLFDALGAAGTTLLRLGIGALLLTLITRPKVRAWGRAQWRAALMLGLTMGAMNLVFYQSIRTVPLGIAVTVEFLGPLTLALVQTRRWVDALWALLAGLGVALLGLAPIEGVPLSGLALAALAGALWAGYIMSSAKVGQLLPGADGLAVALVVGTLLALPFGATGAANAIGDPSLLLRAAAVALLSSVIPYGLELEALRRLPTRVFGVLMSLEPAMAALAGFLVLGQTIGARGLVALVLVSVASAGVTLSRRDGSPAPPLLE